MNHKEHGNRTFTDGQVIATVLYFKGKRAMALDCMDGHIFAKVLKRGPQL